MLVIDCCIRGDDSATRKYYQAYLQTVSEQDIHTLELTKFPIAPLNEETLRKRNVFCEKRDFSHPMFQLAKEFRKAEEILVAAPFWDLSFPALLKVYLELVTVNGLTFGYDKDGRCVGYCNAKRLLYFSTCGGYIGKCHLGFAYVKALAAMLGIEECIPYILEGMDIDPMRREDILAKAISELQHNRTIMKGDGGEW